MNVNESQHIGNVLQYQENLKINELKYTIHIKTKKVFHVCLPPSFPQNKQKIAHISQMKKRQTHCHYKGKKIIQGQFVLILKWL